MKQLTPIAWRSVITLVALAASSFAPADQGIVLAQQELANWQPGPDGTGTNTFMAYVEQPPSGSVASGAPFQISGWLVDTTAQGWAGYDQVQIYSGPMGGGG